MPAPNPWVNQIVGYGEEPPESLLAHPMNPKIHPKSQQDALAGSLNELGWIAPVIVNRVTAHVLDGHARVGLAISRGEPMVPIAYVELSPEQENLAVAIYDPIGAMAAIDREQLDALLQEVSTGDTAVQAMLDGLATEGYGTVPSLDDLANQHGDPGERDFWPVVRVTVPPGTYQRFNELMEMAAGEDEAGKFARLLEAVDAAVLGDE